MTYLAVAVSGTDIGKASLQINQAVDAGAQILELRTDYISDINPGRLKALMGCAKASNLPVIVTCRDISEGGAQDLDQQLRTKILTEAICHGADYVDCEFINFKNRKVASEIKKALSNHPQCRLILSAHDFDKPFDDINLVYDSIISTYPEAIAKIVFKANHVNDCFDVFSLLVNSSTPVIALAMGSQGVTTRIAAKKFNSYLTFASIDDQSSTALGQITVSQMKNLYRFDHTNEETELYGVIGDPVAHSMSPAIFNASYDADKSNAIYVPILLEGDGPQFNEFMDHICKSDIDLGFRGFSVTIPHKANAINYIESMGDAVEPLAASIGAVNTIKVGYGGLISGYNTDYAGALDALLSIMKIEKHQLHSVKVAVIGAGGVARAVVAGLADVGAKVTIYNRTVQKARALSDEFKTKYAPLTEIDQIDAKVLINCTSIGMHPDVDKTPIDKSLVYPDMVVFDTVYNPIKTRLLQEAQSKGACIITGAEMFVRQAMAQYKIFMQKEADENIMRQTVYDNLGSMTES